MTTRPDPATVDVAERLRELDELRARGRTLRDALETTSASRFAHLRAAARALSSLFPGNVVLKTMRTIAPAVEAELPASALERECALACVDDAYFAWRERHVPRPSDHGAIARRIAGFTRSPKFSVVMTTYDTKPEFLVAAIDSVRRQLYPNWQLCVADDGSPDHRVRDILAREAAADSRIAVRFRALNGGMAAAANSALELAAGDFVAFMDHDDLITPDALFRVAAALDEDPTLDWIYSDEDKLTEDGRLDEPYFKPAWNPDTFLSRNYTSHLSVYRRSVLESVGRFRSGFDGSQDYDLALRVSEVTDRIEHVPAVLYHWRRHDNSTAKTAESKLFAFEAGRAAIADAILRRGEPGTVAPVSGAFGAYIVRYALERRDRVSIIIPTRDHGDDVDRCLRSIFASTSYDDFEIILVDNDSTEPASLATFERWREREPRIRIVRYPAPFNFSAINNVANVCATGKYVLFLNNDVEIITQDWLEAMVEQAQRPSIGAVGARLLYFDDTIQHAGVVIAIGGVAGHSHKYFPANAHGYFSTLSAINNYSAVTGACLMMRREVFERVGMFDETLAVAFNDVDLCLRVGAAGYRIVSLPHVRLYHFESKSRGSEATAIQQTRFGAEIAFMENRWHTKSYVDPCYSPHLSITREDYSIRVDGPDERPRNLQLAATAEKTQARA